MVRTSAAAECQSLPLIIHLARVGSRAADAATAPGDLRHRHLVTLRLLSKRGAVCQQALGELLSLDPSNVVGLLNELEDRGLTTRRRDPADRRRHIVELSREGEAELEAANARLTAIEDEILHALSLEERNTLHQLLVRAVGADKPPWEDPPPAAV